MRHSFLPIQEQKVLKRGYRVHAGIVALFLLSALGFVGISSLFPAYLSVSTEESSQASIIASSKKSANALGTASFESDLRRDSGLVGTLALYQGASRPSTLIQEMVSARGSVSITSITLTDVSTTTATMVVQGVAPTRESLVSLKARLENLAVGNKVELPISELAKSRDIPFSLRFTRTMP